MGSPLLRTARPGDTASIVALIGGIFADYGLRLDIAREEVHLRDPGPFFRACGGEFWVVAVAGEIRATAALRLLPDAGELKCLYVHPSLRRQGWGRRLTELAMNRARRAGRRRFILWSDTRFVEAHALYQRLGFRTIGERDLNDSNQSCEYGFELPLLDD